MNNNKKGFTLIELLIALATFSLIIVVMSTVAVSTIKSQRKALALQRIQESARYMLESASKEIRISTINTSGNSYDLDITNDKGTFKYQFYSDKFYRIPEGEVLGPDYLISPDNIKITAFFFVTKSDSPKRAKVTIIMRVESLGVRAEGQAEIYLQTTVSSRAF